MINNGFMYWIFFSLAKMIYGIIPGLYSAFEFFAKNEFFEIDTDIKTVWGNLYVLLSVLVLFAIAIKLINAIVNPDVLTDNKKGVKKVYFSAVVAVFLTILTPYMFTLLIHVQDDILENKTIDKLFFNSTGTEDTGKVVAWTAITSFINLKDLSDNTDYVLDTSRLQGETGQTFVLEEEVDRGLDEIYDAQPWQHTDTVRQNPILMLLAGVLIVYEFVILVMDTALRSIKLGLLQMMTPIVLGAYIFKEDILKKWFLEYIKTFIQVFLVLIAISLLTKILSVMPNILAGSSYSDNWFMQGIINTIAIMGALRLVRQLFPLINKIFGTNLEGKGGIRGRLGEMAMVGGLAQRAFDTLRQHPIQTGRRVLSAPISAVGGATAHITAAGMRAANMMDRGNIRGGLATLAGGVLTSGAAAIRGARQGWRNANLQGIGAQGHRYEDTHIGNSTLGGRIIDTTRTTLGLRTREEEEVANANSITVRGQQMSFEELEARQKLYNQVNSSASNIRSTIESGMKTNTSNVVFDGAAAIRATSGGRTVTLTGNYNSVLEQIETLKNAGPSGGMTNEDHASLISSLRHQLDLSADNARDSILAQYMRNGDLVANINGHAVAFQAGQTAQIKAEMAHITDILDNNQEMFNAMASNNTVRGVATNMSRNNTTGNLQFGDNFMAGAMRGIYDYLADVNRSVNAYNDEQSARRTSQQGRERHDSSTSVRNANNNAGNNNGGNNRH